MRAFDPIVKHRVTVRDQNRLWLGSRACQERGLVWPPEIMRLRYLQGFCRVRCNIRIPPRRSFRCRCTSGRYFPPRPPGPARQRRQARDRLNRKMSWHVSFNAGYGTVRSQTVAGAAGSNRTQSEAEQRCRAGLLGCVTISAQSTLAAICGRGTGQASGRPLYCVNNTVMPRGPA